MKSPSDDERDYRAAHRRGRPPLGPVPVLSPPRAPGPSRSSPSIRAASLSLQYHARRAEFWVALDDGLEITVGERIWRPARGEEIYIPRGAAHRLRSAGTAPARVMEIWLGDSDESDIVRLDDAYGRTGS